MSILYTLGLFIITAIAEIVGCYLPYLWQTQWQAFLRKNALEALSLEDIVNCLVDFLMPAAEAANSGDSFPFHWTAGGPWSPRSGN